MNDAIIQKLNAFFGKYPAIHYKKGDILIQAGSNPSGIFYVEEGVVRRYLISKNGTETTLNMYKPHTFLPMSWAISDTQNNHFYEAMTDVVARRAPKQDVLAFIKQEPEVVYDLLRRVYIGMEGLWNHLEYLTTTNSTSKLISTLVILGKRFGKEENGGRVIQLKMAEQDIANYSGMSRETVSREMRKLIQQQKVTLVKGVITIHNLQKLEEELYL